jgi:hypothetical protein
MGMNYNWEQNQILHKNCYQLMVPNCGMKYFMFNLFKEEKRRDPVYLASMAAHSGEFPSLFTFTSAPVF